MSADFKYFPDILKEVIDKVRLCFDQTAPFFEYGTYLELMEVCQRKDNNQIAKYPLIWLVWDSKENSENWLDPCMYNISPLVFICDLSKIDDGTVERYANTIKVTLYPIFELLIDRLGYHGNVLLSSDFKYSVKDHPFWLNETDGSFDTLSAIEIKLENLLILKN